MEPDFSVTLMRRLCRLCMGADIHMRPIYDDHEVIGTGSIASQILSITELKISTGDGLPTQICDHCFERLQLSFEFRQLARTTDTVLRSRLNQSISVKIEHEDDISEQSPKYVDSDSDLEHESLKYKCQAVLHNPKVTPTDVENVGSNSVSDRGANSKRDSQESFSPEDNQGGHQSNTDLVPSTSSKQSKSSKHRKGNKSSSESHLKRSIEILPAGTEITLMSRNFQCTECAKCYSNRKTLTHHMRIHTGQNLHECSLCKKTFIYPYLLAEHKRFHTGERPYQCTVCSKAFNHKNDFGKHMRTHTKEKPYACSFCKKLFSQKGHLVVHIRCHTGEKPYVCPKCNKSFAYQNSLSLHILNHTESKEFTCVFCSKSFPHEKSLKKHSKYHTDAKPYECKTCKKAFFYPGDLTAHIRTHTGERPYCCTVCKKTFIQKRQLTSHARLHEQ